MQSMFRIGFMVLLNLFILTRAEEPTRMLLSRERESRPVENEESAPDLKKRYILPSVEYPGLDPEDLIETSSLDKRGFDSIDGTDFRSMGKRPFDSISGGSFSQLGKRKFDSISGGTFSQMGKRPFDSIDGGSFNTMGKRKFDSIASSSFGSMGKRPFDSISDGMFNTMGKRHFDSISDSNFSRMGKRQFDVIGHSRFNKMGNGAESRLFRRNFDRISGFEGLSPGFPRLMGSHVKRPFKYYGGRPSKAEKWTAKPDLEKSKCINKCISKK